MKSSKILSKCFHTTYFNNTIVHDSQDKMVQLNACLAFFLHDLLSVMDRGYVFTLIRTYMKDLSARSSCQSGNTFDNEHLLKTKVLSEFTEKERQMSRQPFGGCRLTS